jgi:hypothetical protein
MNTTARVFAVLFLTAILSAPFADAGRSGDDYYLLGRQQEDENSYIAATKSYKKAAALYSKEKNLGGLVNAKNAYCRTFFVTLSYSIPEGKLEKTVRKEYPWASKDEIEGWLGSMEMLSLTMDKGKRYFFGEEPSNLKFRNAAIMAGWIEHKSNPLGTMMQMFMDDYIKADYSSYNLPYDRPKDVLVDFQLTIPKSKLPKAGVARVWMPLPINTDCQGGIQIISLEPAEYMLQQPDFNADIGLAYFEIPIDKVKKSLDVRAQIRFLHYQQRFVVDPANVGEYDRESELYKKYTVSAGNTLITPEIAVWAAQIVGDETNPYCAAKMIYDYIVFGAGGDPEKKVDYSYTPHSALQGMAKPESVFVHEKQLGDCGAQSIYFSALCRSQGIPARTCGGFQFFNGSPGTHFWAEFYLPNYGWIPVDVTAAGLGDEVSGFPATDVKAFKDYFFGQMDSLRYVIQNDVDIPLIPPAGEETFMSIVIQNPEVIYEGTDKMYFDNGPKPTFFSYSDLAFNYENAIKALPGAEIEVAAADFALDRFNAKSKFKLVQPYHGKTAASNLEIKQFSADMKTATCKIPQNAGTVAFKLACAPPKADEIVSAKRVIVHMK